MNFDDSSGKAAESKTGVSDLDLFRAKLKEFFSVYGNGP
jgi:hypothetical protein